MFTSILTDTVSTMSIESALICVAISLILGAVIALVYRLQDKGTKSLTLALIVLPTIVQVIIMLVNGNLGVGVAVMGAFSLVRFRSVPGNAKDICFIFFAMAVGLATGTGYIFFAAIITVVLCVIMFVMGKLPILNPNNNSKQLRITIPEDLDYNGCFDDIFEKYTSNNELIKVKTTNMGTMFELTYIINEKDISLEKKMIDEIRCRNGNLTVMCNKIMMNPEEL